MEGWSPLWAEAAADEDPLAGAGRIWEASGPERAGGADVLLVENDGAVRECIAEMLSDFGLRVTEAASAAQALALVGSRGLPPLLVTDLRLGPGMDGRELAAALRSRQPSLRAVLISGSEVGSDGLDGCDVFLRKPFRGDDLTRAMWLARAA